MTRTTIAREYKTEEYTTMELHATTGLPDRRVTQADIDGWPEPSDLRDVLAAPPLTEARYDGRGKHWIVCGSHFEDRAYCRNPHCDFDVRGHWYDIRRASRYHLRDVEAAALDM